jgi:hypothetical protein
MKRISRQLTALFAVSATTAALALVGSEARAQTPVNPILPTTGTREIFLNGNIIFNPDSAQDISIGYGPFLSPNIQVGGQVNYVNPAGSNSEDFYDFSGFVNYHFPSASALLPFVGATLGYTDPGSGDGSVVYGVQGGVKYFVNPNVSVNGTLLWRDFTKSNYDNDFRLTFGISAYLR